MSENYLIGQIPALDLIEEFGSPIFVYNLDKIKSQYFKLSNAFNKLDHRIHYACKANEAIEILSYIKDIGGGVDTVSPNEILRCLKAGFDKEDIIFTPSCPSLEELRFAFDRNIKVNLGSTEYLEMMGFELKGKNIGLRLNPAVAIEGNQKIATAHANSKFGIPLDQLDLVKDYCRKYQIGVNTLHVHTGSEVNDWHDLKRSFDVMYGLLDEFKDVTTLDLGSGFKVKYSGKEEQIDLEAYAQHIEKRLNNYSRPIQVVLEPGKYLVAQSGYLLTRVNVVKQGYFRKFVGVNSGFHHLIRPMYYDAFHQIENISNPEGEVGLYDVVGQLCEEDTFARDIPLNEVRVGDILSFEHAGAYAYAMSMQYNLREKPAQIMIRDGIITLASEEKIQI